MLGEDSCWLDNTPIALDLCLHLRRLPTLNTSASTPTVTDRSSSAKKETTTMNSPSSLRVRHLMALATFCFASTAFAHGAALSTHDGMQRTAAPACACTLAADAAVRSSPEPGPYAKYLIHLGHSKEAAMEAARSIDAGQAAADSAVSGSSRTQGAMSHRTTP